MKILLSNHFNHQSFEHIVKHDSTLVVFLDDTNSTMLSLIQNDAWDNELFSTLTTEKVEERTEIAIEKRKRRSNYHMKQVHSSVLFFHNKSMMLIFLI